MTDDPSIAQSVGPKAELAKAEARVRELEQARDKAQAQVIENLKYLAQAQVIENLKYLDYALESRNKFKAALEARDATDRKRV
jgi:hypothetical protein